MGTLPVSPISPACARKRLLRTRKTGAAMEAGIAAQQYESSAKSQKRRSWRIYSGHPAGRFGGVADLRRTAVACITIA